MSGWDPQTWFGDAGKAISNLDPSQVGKSKASVGAPTAAPAVGSPTLAPTVTGPTNDSKLPQMAAPTEGPAATTIASTAGPTASTVDTSQAKAVGDAQGYTQGGVNSQSALMQQLANQANGVGPSVSGMQLQQGQNANLAATMAQLSSQRGAANPLMQRQAMMSGSDSQAAMNQQAAINRLQEQQGAQGLLGQVSGQAVNQGLAARSQDMGLRQQDLNTASQNSSQAQQAALAGYGGNLQTNLAQAGINAGNASQLFGAQQNANQQNAGFQQGMNNLGFQYAGLGQQAQIANQNSFNQNQGLNQQAALGNQASFNQNQQQALQAQLGNANIAQSNAANQAQVVGGLVSGGAGILAAGAKPGASPPPTSTAAEGGYAAGKPSVEGDSLKNDKVPAWISPGEVVVPRTVVNAKDPIEAFKTFMQTVHNKPIGQPQTSDDALKTVMEAQAKMRAK